MMKKLNRYIWLITILHLLILSSSCMNDDLVDASTDNLIEEGEQFKVNISVDHLKKPIFTRADSESESPFGSLHFLIFKAKNTIQIDSKQRADESEGLHGEDVLVEVVKNLKLIKKEEKNFHYSFSFKAEEKTTYNLVVVANTELPTTLKPGETTLSDLSSSLTFHLSDIFSKTKEDITKSIPLWAELYAFYHKENNKTPTTPTQVDVPLIPAVAKVSLSFKEANQKIIEVWLHKANKIGNIPYKDDSSFWGLNVNESSSEEWFQLLSESKTDDESLSELSYYLTEAYSNNKKDCACLVVKIADKFYRIDFREGDSEDLNLLPVVRNNHYVFTITGVGENSGSTNKEDALDNIYQKIEYEMATWEDFILDMHYDSDGKYIGIGVSKKNHLKEEDILLSIQTNFTSTEIKKFLKNKKLMVDVKKDGTTTTIPLSNEVELVTGVKWYLKIPYQEDFNEQELSITINYERKHDFGPFHVRYGKLLEYFRITDASWNTSETGSGASGNQVFYAVHESKPNIPFVNRALDVKFVYKVGGDEEINVEEFVTNTIDDMYFKCDGFKLDPKGETGSFQMKYQGSGPTINNFQKNGKDVENLVVRDTLIYDFEIDLSEQLDPYFDKKQSSNRVDRLRFRVPIVGTDKPGDFYKILFWGADESGSEMYQYGKFRELVRANLYSKEEQNAHETSFPQFKLRGIPIDSGNNEKINLSHYHAIFYLMTNIDNINTLEVRSHWVKLNEIYKENIAETGRTIGTEHYRLIMHCSHSDATRSYKLIGSNDKFTLNRTMYGKPGIWSDDKFTKPVLSTKISYNNEDISLGLCLVNTAAIGEKYQRNINSIAGNIQLTNYNNKLVKSKSLLGLSPTGTNYWWFGSSAFFENKIYDTTLDIYNKALTNDILRPLKQMYGKVGNPITNYHKVPIMKKIKTEYYDYPIVTFGVEYINNTK